jgi:hypothetical protein
MSESGSQDMLTEGLAFHRAGRLAEAEAVYRRILAQQPGNRDALHLLGVIASQVGRHDVAVELIRKAIDNLPPDRINSSLGEAHNNLGRALMELDRLEEAVDSFHAAIRCSPQNALFHQNLASALEAGGDLDAAINEYQRAISLDPQLPDAHHGLALSLLAMGRFENAWPELEWRWRVQRLGAPRPDIPKPLWDGSELNGRRIFVYAEQGFGDAIQFSRYLPLLAQRGARVSFACQDELARLMSRVQGVARVLGASVDMDFDVHCPLLSLPLHFATTLESIPADIPYLSADPDAQRSWRDRIARLGKGRPRIGLVWSGNPAHPRDKSRSLRLLDLAPLAEAASSASLISLQKGPARHDLRSPPDGLNIVDWTGELHDFADTAALIANLDLVISADTAVAHLAGALGKRVWVLLPHTPDWRWMLHRSDSPWYPTMRLFRQERRGEWTAPVWNVIQALEKMQP